MQYDFNILICFIDILGYKFFGNLILIIDIIFKIWSLYFFWKIVYVIQYQSRSVALFEWINEY